MKNDGMLLVVYLKRIFLLVLLTAFSGNLYAQRNLRCPKPKREKSYNKPLLIDHLAVNTFLTYPIAYKYRVPVNSHYFKPISRLGFAANFQNYFIVSDKVEWVTDIMFAMNTQGLKFQFDEDGSSATDKYSVTSWQYRLSTGLSYNVDEKWNVALMPSVVYNEVIGYVSSATSTTNGSGSLSAMGDWSDDNFEKDWYLGASLQARYNVSKRVYACFSTAIDFKASSPTSGLVELNTRTGATEVTAYKHPYLLYLGVGLGFRLTEWSRAGY